jgi:hypothetical protein
VARPDLVLLDDPQTTESATSPDQSATRERIIAADVLGMAGPDKSLAALMTLTVVAPGDMADNVLDRDKHPDWRGERTKLLYDWPCEAAMVLWEEYDEIRRRHLQEDDAAATPKEATEFYAAHREAMDKGGRVAWSERFLPGDISALQHAMNLYFRSPAAFQTEYQNEPLDAKLDETFLTAKQLAKKTNGYICGQVARDAQWITVGVDVQKRVLYYVVVAWSPRFDGYILDYGTFPKPRRLTFTAANFRPTLQEIYPGTGAEGAVFGGLTTLANDLAARKWARDDGGEMKLSKVVIDGRYMGDVVRKLSREHPLAPIILPAIGQGFGPSETPISGWRPRVGEMQGTEWLLRRGRGRNSQHLLWDGNYWKTFLARRWATAAGDAGCLSLFGRQTQKRHANHDAYARQLDAEYPEQLLGRRAVTVWKIRPGYSENHWLDATLMASVGASVCGAKVIGAESGPKQKRVSLSELQARAKRGKR